MLLNTIFIIVIMIFDKSNVHELYNNKKRLKILFGQINGFIKDIIFCMGKTDLQRKW